MLPGKPVIAIVYRRQPLLNFWVTWLVCQELMIKNKSLVLIKDKVKKINFLSKKIELVCKNKIFKADILVNVSGPQTTNKISDEVPLINSFKNGLV